MPMRLVELRPPDSANLVLVTSMPPTVRITLRGHEALLDVMRPEDIGNLLFFVQAEDGIRDKLVTGVQTCALPIYLLLAHGPDLSCLFRHLESRQRRRPRRSGQHPSWRGCPAPVPAGGYPQPRCWPHPARARPTTAGPVTWVSGGGARNL